jgi:hypothetical protein
VTQRFDTEAMAMALFEHDASGLGCLGHPGWDWESQADDVRATRLADAGQLIQRYITRAEERAPTEPTTAPLATGAMTAPTDLARLQAAVFFVPGELQDDLAEAFDEVRREAAACAERALVKRLEAAIPSGDNLQHIISSPGRLPDHERERIHRRLVEDTAQALRGEVGR